VKPSEQRIVEGILFTDEYQLTMAQLYLRDRPARKASAV
jgi:nicotinic acid phosphoribosyltransferase